MQYNQIEDELDLVRIQLQILTYRMRKNIKKCNRVAESIDRTIQKIQFIPSESNDEVIYKSGNSSTCHSYLRKSRISFHSSSSFK
jgi:hypothetical protein